MPRRNDLERIVILGSGPIRIGQAAEFDFSGSQACRALRADGYEIILINSNPATIQNDPEMADRIYIEPLLPEVVKRILEIEKPDALLAGMGGQTALNIASALAHDGSLDELGVELIGCDLVAIDEAEDRDLFKKVCEEIDLPVCKALACDSIEAVIAAAETLGGFPLLIRPAYTLGGLGGGTAHDMGQLVEIASQGILHSAIGQVLIEVSILGWQEHEYKTLRKECSHRTRAAFAQPAGATNWKPHSRCAMSTPMTAQSRVSTSLAGAHSPSNSIQRPALAHTMQPLSSTDSKRWLPTTSRVSPYQQQEVMPDASS